VKIRYRNRQTALAVSYPSSSYRRANFDALYAEHCRSTGKRMSDRGRQTRWIAYQGIVRAIRSRSGAIRTSNGQRAQQYAKDGRARSTRTVRRCHRDLEAMGMIVVRHVVKSGPARRPGELDCLAIALQPLRGQSFVRPLRSRVGRQALNPACTTMSPPPTAAENDPDGRWHPPPSTTLASDGSENDAAIWGGIGLPGAERVRLIDWSSDP
jgi:hypothetical protein